MQKFKELLSSRGIKPTYQRLKLMKYLKGVCSHPTADNIYKALVKDMPTISKTTVYNTLKVLADKGILLPISITGTEVRYDFAGSRHHHFLCEKCHKISDINVICPNLEREEINGNIIKELHGYFKGVCAKCNNKNTSSVASGQKSVQGKSICK